MGLDGHFPVSCRLAAGQQALQHLKSFAIGPVMNAIAALCVKQLALQPVQFRRVRAKSGCQQLCMFRLQYLKVAHDPILIEQGKRRVRC